MFQIDTRTCEESVIGMIIADPCRFDEARESGVGRGHFSFEYLANAWDAMVALRESGQEIELTSVAAFVPKQDVAPIFSAYESCPLTQNFEFWLKELHEAHWARTTSVTLSRLAQSISRRRPFEETQSLRSELSASLLNHADSPANSFATRSQIDIAVDLINEILDENRRPIMSGIKSIDTVYGGLMAPDLWVLGARPSVGKTTLGVTIAENAAASGSWVLFFSAEMRETQILAKKVSRLANIDMRKIRRGSLTEEERNRFSAVVEEHKNSKLNINSRAAYNIETIEDEIRRFHRQGKLDLAVIDYIQLIDAHGKWESRQKELSHITKRLKVICTSLNIVILACAQVNREVETVSSGPRASRRKPKLGNLKDSGSIEQDADNVVFIDRDDSGMQSKYMLLFEKVRSGPVGAFAIDANLAINEFSDRNYNHREEIHQ